MKVGFRSAAPAVPVRPGRWPDGTRPSSDTSSATAAAVGVARAPDGRREHEVCTVRVTDARAVMTAGRFPGCTGLSHVIKNNRHTHHIPTSVPIQWLGMIVARSAKQLPEVLP